MTRTIPLTFALFLIILAACKKNEVPAIEDPLKNSLLAFYPFNGNALDESGNSYHLSNHGATLVSDRFGESSKAYSFDGVKSFMKIPGLLKADSLREFTISAWVKTETLSDVCIFSLFEKNDWVSCSTTLTLDNTNGRFWVYHEMVYSLRGNTCTASSFSDSISNPVNQWTHLVVVQRFNANNSYSLLNQYSSYVNNSKLAGGAASNPNANSFSRGGVIGCKNTTGNDNFNFTFTKGSIDDIRIYSRALSDDEVSRLYNLKY